MYNTGNVHTPNALEVLVHGDETKLEIIPSPMLSAAAIRNAKEVSHILQPTMKLQIPGGAHLGTYKRF